MKKSAILLFVSALMMSLLQAVFAQTPPFDAGDGTEGNPFQISTAAQVFEVRHHLDQHFKLINDIDLSDFDNWEPIRGMGSEGRHQPFTGVFDGSGYQITGLTINRPEEEDVGLFAYVKGGTVMNLSVAIESVHGGESVGGLIGYAVDARVHNSSVTGEVSGRAYEVGGLIGFMYDATVTNSYATGRVSVDEGWVGGLIGYVGGSHATFSLIRDSYATSDVRGTGSLGGLIGHADQGALLENTYATGAVLGPVTDTGGLVGSAENIKITSSFWDMETTGQLSSPGGGSGRTTPQMKQEAAYTQAGWDFDHTWSLQGLNPECALPYPYLKTNAQNPTPGSIDLEPSFKSAQGPPSITHPRATPPPPDRRVISWLILFP